MKRRNCILGSAALAVAALSSFPAWSAPDNYAFGYSGYDGIEALTLDGSTPILTNGFQGWVSNGGAPNTGGPDGNTNYIAGTYQDNEFANYFVFSLSGVAGPVTSAELTISPYSITQAFTYVLHDATPYASSLLDAASPDPLLYSALGTGTILGSFSVTPDESNGSPLVFALNSTGINDLNADISAGASEFAISGTVLGQAGSTGAVPEASTWLLMIVGFGGLGLKFCLAKKASGFKSQASLAA